MPTYLYKERIDSISNETFQSHKTFDLLWYSLYRVPDYKNHRTEHFFLVPPHETTFLRLFLDTHSTLPHKSIKYMILDFEQTLIHHDSVTDGQTIVLKINSKDKKEAREFKLVLIYEGGLISQGKECAQLEILMVLQTMERVT
jgi:hypothetical protein